MLSTFRNGWLRLAFVALGFAAPVAFTADIPDTIGQRMQPCMVCHGPEGRATTQGFFPRIAGKPAAYLYNQLLAFRDGRRSNPTMAYFVDHMTDSYLQEIAQYFAALDLPYPPARPATDVTQTQLARGEGLVRHGDSELGVPACARCHGVALTGALPAIPGLLGLPREYLQLQFGSWRVGVRRTRAPDCMSQIVSRMSPQDLNDIAAWLSSQPVPAAAAPTAQLARPLPTPCGSDLP
ncbi:MAG TPA: cytochrome c4 [Burkholderiaceae bacterium]|nr:cytochrome c4 [Burkholderiaceae bacterium]